MEFLTVVLLLIGFVSLWIRLGHLSKGTRQHIMALQDEIDALKTEVANESTVEASAVTLIQGLKTSLDAAIQSAQNAGATATQLADLHTLRDTLQSDDQGLAAAVTANTPAAPTQPAPAPTS